GTQPPLSCSSCADRTQRDVRARRLLERRPLCFRATQPAGLSLAQRAARCRKEHSPRRPRGAQIIQSHRCFMINKEQDHELLRAQGEGHLIASTPGSPPPGQGGRRRMGFGQRAVVAILLTVVLVPPAAGFYSYFTGIPLHLLASTSDKPQDNEKATPAAS